MKYRPCLFLSISLNMSEDNDKEAKSRAFCLNEESNKEFGFLDVS